MIKSVLDAIFEKSLHSDTVKDYNNRLKDLLEIFENVCFFQYRQIDPERTHKITFSDLRWHLPSNSPYESMSRDTYEATMIGTIRYNYVSPTVTHSFQVDDQILANFPVMLNSELCTTTTGHRECVETHCNRNFSIPAFCVNRNFRLCPAEEVVIQNRPVLKKENYVQVRSRFVQNNRKYRTNATLKLFCRKIVQKHIFQRFEYVLEIPYKTPKSYIPIYLFLIIFADGAFSIAEIKELVCKALQYYKIASTHIILQWAFPPECEDLDAEKALLRIRSLMLDKSSTLYAKTQIPAAIKRTLVREFVPHLFNHSDLQRFMCFLGALTRLIECSTPAKQLLQAKCHLHVHRNSYVYKRIETVGHKMCTLMRKYCRELKCRMQTNMTKFLKRKEYVHHLEDLGKIFSARYMNLSASVQNGVWDSAKDVTEHNQNKTQLLGTAHCNDGIQVEFHKILKSTLKNTTDPKYLMTHPTQYGRLCLYLTPESEKCGVSRFKAIGCRITSTLDTALIRFVVQRFLTTLADTVFVPFSKPNLSSHVDQYWVRTSSGEVLGFTCKPLQFVNSFRKFRRSGRLHAHVGIEMDSTCTVLYINFDQGRLLRPLLVQEKIHCLAAFMDSDLYQYSENRLGDLVAHNFVEYVDAGEEYSDFTRVAERWEDSSDSYTHAEIHGCLGMSLTVNKLFANHNQGPRRMYTGNMEKRSISAKHAVDMGTTCSNSLWYWQRPLMTDIVDESLNLRVKEPNGLNVNIAVLSLGQNQEDSWIFKKEALERGLLTCNEYRVYTVATNQNSHFERPGFCCLNKNREYCYRHLDPNGLPKIGARLVGGDAIVGKITEISTKQGDPVVRCTSKFVPFNVTYVVHDVLTEPKNVPMDRVILVRVILRSTHQPEVGDKFFLSHGQKGTCGLIEASENLPYIVGGVNDGMIPDVIINVCSLMRVTQGLLLEMLFSKCKTLDTENKLSRYNTLFESPSSIERQLKTCREILESAGLHYSGKDYMRCGKTGRFIQCSIYNGFANMRALKHLSKNKLRSRDRGPINEMTRQPTAGKNVFGGQKFGEMENWNLHSLGMPHMFQNVNFNASDTFEIFQCTSCQVQAIGNRERDYFYCTSCGRSDTVVSVQLPYTTNLVIQELQAMGLGHRLHLNNSENCDEI